MSLTQDIETAVEEKFKLKEIDRYSKYWTYEDLIFDWVKMYGELTKSQFEGKDLKKQVTQISATLKSQAEEIAQINAEFKTLNYANAELRSEIAQLQGQFSTVSSERDTLIDSQKAFDHALEKLRGENKELSDKLLSSNPIKAYAIKDLLGEIFERIFKGGV